MQASVLAVGEAITDVVESGGTVTDYPGGSPLNIAVGLGRLGISVALLAAIGEDDRGRALVDHLRTSGVSIAPGTIRPEPTSTSRAIIDADGSAQYVFDIRWTLPGPVSLQGVRILHVGSLGAFVEPGGASVAELVARADAAGVIVTFDPNIRPAVCGAHAAAFARFAAIASHSTVVKLSDEDAAWLYPGWTESDVVVDVLARGARLAIVTRGSSGALLATSSHTVEVPAATVEVADTIGAGDSFMAAVIAELSVTIAGIDRLERVDLERWGEFATRCAGVTVSRAGANPPFSAEVGR